MLCSGRGSSASQRTEAKRHVYWVVTADVHEEKSTGETASKCGLTDMTTGEDENWIEDLSKENVSLIVRRVQ